MHGYREYEATIKVLHEGTIWVKLENVLLFRISRRWKQTPYGMLDNLINTVVGDGKMTRNDTDFPHNL